ncbi:MAG: S-layer homology domain-containing protein [Phascolarctobacterium sp.]|nr:S-layer homology domain-containing protein [Phascolarctobacterium sp.]
MKKSLVLAMAMALGVTASAYAANPFSDVPAGHWAYDSIAKLAAAGVVDGYPDGTFGGDRLLTRYEMAQVVARAMAKGANVDRLAAEFADELDALGVRVARLEKNADNVKITGQIRYSYDASHSDAYGSASNLRTRIWFRGQANDNWAYTGMVQNIQNFAHNNVEENRTDWQRAWVDGRVGGVKVMAGRYNFTDFLQNRGYMHDARFDGGELSYGKNIKLTVGGGKVSDSVTEGSSIGDDAIYADLRYQTKGIGANVSYYGVKDLGKGGSNDATKGSRFGKFVDHDVDLFTAGVSFGIAKDDVKLAVDYLHSSLGSQTTKDGVLIGLNVLGAKASKPGTFGVWAKYLNQPAGTIWNSTMPFSSYSRTGYEGGAVGADYTFAKNLVGAVHYYNLDAKNGGVDTETLWTQLILTF